MIQKYLILFFLILGFGSVFELFFPTVVQVAELFFVLLLLIGQKGKLKGNYGVYLVVIYLCVLISSILTSTSITKYFSLILRPIFGLLILSAFNYKYDDIKFCFSKVLKFVAVLALLNVLLTTFASGFFSVKKSASGYEVHTILYVFNYIQGGITERMGFTIIRNQGLFWEPGVLGILMNLLIYIELFEYKKKIIHVLLPVFVLLTTLSTTGYIVFSILLGVRYYNQVRHSGGFRNKIATIVGAIILIGAFIPLLMNEITYKSTEGIGSANKRQFDMMTGIAIVKDHPVIGIGPDRDVYIKEANTHLIYVGDNVTYDARASSNILTTLFASYGIPFALLFFIALYRQNVFINRKIFFLVVSIGLMSEPVVFVDLFFVWIMSGTYKKRDQLCINPVGVNSNM